MSRRGVIGIFVALIGLGLAAVGIFVLMSMVRRSLTPSAALPTPEPELNQPVVVTRRDIALGAVLKASDLAVIDIPVEAAPLNVLTDLELASGRITKIPLVAGEMVMPHHLADPTNVHGDLAYILPNDQVLMAFPVMDLMTDLSLVQRGGMVDILVSFSVPVLPEEAGAAVLAEGEEEEEETRLFTFDAMERIEITAVVADIITEGQPAPAPAGVPGATPEPTPIPDPSQVEIKALLLALPPQEALVLKHLKDAGATFDIVLRSPTSREIFELDPVMREYLIDRYELEITK